MSSLREVFLGSLYSFFLQLMWIKKLVNAKFTCISQNSNSNCPLPETNIPICGQMFPTPRKLKRDHISLLTWWGGYDEAGHGVGIDIFPKFAVKFPAHRQIIPVKCAEISPPWAAHKSFDLRRGTLGGTQYRNTVRKNAKYRNTASKIV